ncbi:MAG TPA: hypothetical protein VGC30_11635 [Dokdonella sp.]
MSTRVALALALLLAAPAPLLAAEGAPKYAPGIVGRLTVNGRAEPANICLRSAGSDVLQCAYTDFDGRFYIPSLGEVAPRDADAGDARTGAYPQHWLELGTRADGAVRLYAVPLQDDRTIVLHLDCDVARGADGRHCEPARAPARTLARRGR